MSIYDPTPGQQLFGPCLPSYDELQGCIRCGRCLPVCPTYGETQLEMYSPRGRLSLLRAVEDGKLGITSGVEAHLYHCLDCRACNTVCPPGVRIGELIVRGRVAVEEQHPRPRWIKFMLQHVLTGAERAEVLSGPLRGTQFLKLDRLGAGALGWVPGIGAKLRQLVEFAPQMRKPIRAELPPVTPAVGARRHRVAFFLGCMMNVAMPDVSRATVRVLARAGCDVVTPRGQACCGAPQDDQAMLDLSRDMARRNIALFEPLLDEVEAIVTDCAGCSAALKEYAEWLHDDPAWAERAQAFCAKVRDVTEWLDAVWPEDLPLRHAPVRGDLSRSVSPGEPPERAQPAAAAAGARRGVGAAAAARQPPGALLRQCGHLQPDAHADGAEPARPQDGRRGGDGRRAGGERQPRLSDAARMGPPAQRGERSRSSTWCRCWTRVWQDTDNHGDAETRRCGESVIPQNSCHPERAGPVRCVATKIQRRVSVQRGDSSSFLKLCPSWPW